MLDPPTTLAARAGTRGAIYHHLADKLRVVSRPPLLLISVLASGLLLAAPVVCQAQVAFTEFPGPPAPAQPTDIAPGPDGDLWFTEDPGSQIGRATTAGVLTLFSVPSGKSGGPITAGPDGNMWFTEYFAGKIGRVTTDGVFTEFSIPTGGSYPAGIASGADGNLWFTETQTNNIGRITPAGVITEFPGLSDNANQITAGPDGNIWFTENNANNIGRITPSGAVTEFAVLTSGSYPFKITVGSDGNLWFTEQLTNQIGRITPAGVITEFPIPTAASDTDYITAGPDGNLWFTERAGNNLGRITTAGVITEFPIPTAGSNPLGITTGPDGNLWFVEYSANKIVKAVLTTGDQTAPATTAALSPASPNGSNGWYTQSVTVTLSATDPDGPADVASTFYTVDGGTSQTYTSPFTVSTDGSHTVSYWSKDAAGNTEAPHSISFQIDQTPPVITAADVVAAATSANGAVVIFSPTAIDNLSGVVGSVTCTPASGSHFPLGTTVVTTKATDAAGNIATKLFDVSVTYSWSFFLQPINADGSSIFKLGSTVPVKFQLTGASASITNAVAKLYVAQVSGNVTGTYVEAASTAAADSGDLFRYDATSNQYIFNLGTKSLSTGTWRLKVDLGDGAPDSQRTVLISLK